MDQFHSTRGFKVKILPISIEAGYYGTYKQLQFLAGRLSRPYCQMQNRALVILGQTYRAEILATRSVSDIIDRCMNQKTMFYLDRLLAIHVANQHQIRDICKTLRYSPGDDLEVPPRIEKLLTKKNVPERLLLSWLAQCEARLSELYKEVETSTLPEGLAKNFNSVKERQQAMLEELNILNLDSTEVLDLAAWES